MWEKDRWAVFLYVQGAHATRPEEWGPTASWRPRPVASDNAIPTTVTVHGDSEAARACSEADAMDRLPMSEMIAFVHSCFVEVGVGIKSEVAWTC